MVSVTRPPTASVDPQQAPLHDTVPLLPMPGVDVGAGPVGEPAYVNPAGKASLTLMLVTVVDELFVYVIVNLTTSPRLYELSGTDGFDSSEAVFEAVRLAVVTVTPEGSVPDRVPEPVGSVARFNEVPPDR